MMSSTHTCTEPNRIFDDTTLDLGMQSWHALIIEGHLATYENIEYNTKTPDVYLGTGVDLGIEEFRRSKV
jgi:hypothetical protein